MKLYTLKVDVDGFKGIWRWLEISGNCTFDDLHALIFEAYDRHDEHLYKFYFPREKTASFQKIYNSPLVVEHFALYEDSIKDEWYNLPYIARGLPPPALKRTDKYRINEAELKEKESFYYEFDMGDEWWHRIRVEKIVDVPEAKKNTKVMRITQRKGDSPPQYPEQEEIDRSEYELVIDSSGPVSIGHYVKKTTKG